MTYIADTVILLRYFEAHGRVRRAISVIKKRTGTHEDTIREFRIGRNGITLGEPLTEFQGILQRRSVLRRRQHPAGDRDSDDTWSRSGARAHPGAAGRDAALAAGPAARGRHRAASVCPTSAPCVAQLEEGAGVAIIAEEAVRMSI